MPKLAVDRGPADAQRAGGLRHVATRFVHGAADQRGLQVAQGNARAFSR